MERNLLIFIAIGLTLVSYFALARPVTIIRFMHAWLLFWVRLFGSNVLTYEQSSMIELAKKDPREYERRYPSQINIVRSMGVISILIVIASLCMILA